MDNHKWACWVWEQQLGRCTESKPPTLLHADYHFDGIDDFLDNPKELDKMLVESVDKLKLRIKKNKTIKYDSFIAPVIRRDVVVYVHFYCREDEIDDAGLGHQTLEQCGAKQIFCDSVEAFARALISGRHIFDLCLDLFNRENEQEYEGALWPEDDIRQALVTWHELIFWADCVTISLSFGYSGTEEHTKYLAKLVLTDILASLDGTVV